MDKTPQLIESGTKYFLKETLKQCNKTRTKYNNFITNFILFTVLTIILGLFLYYRFHSKPTKKDMKKTDLENKIFILNKIKECSEKKRRQDNEIITNLPKF